MEISLISFNIWDLPLLGSRSRRERVSQVAAYLKDLKSDIICLQESFDIRNRNLIYEKIGPRDYYMTDGGSARKALFFLSLDSTGGLAIFSKFPIRRSRFVPFSRIWNSAFSEFFSRKGFLEAVVETPHGLLRVVNVHLHQPSFFLDSYVRQSQIKYLLKYLEDDYGNLPVLLAGDLNEHNLARKTPFAEFLRTAGFLHPSLGLGRELAPTYRPENRYVKNLINWPFQGPYRLDYFFLKGLREIGLGVSRYEPVHLSPPLSDHDPVVLVLKRER